MRYDISEGSWQDIEQLLNVEDVVVYCESGEVADNLLSKLDDLGYHWFTGDSLLKYNFLDASTEGIYYFIPEICGYKGVTFVTLRDKEYYDEFYSNSIKKHIKYTPSRSDKGVGSGFYTFEEAKDLLEKGCRLTRKNWEDDSSFIYLVEGSEVSKIRLRGKAKKYVGMKGKLTDKIKISSHIDKYDSKSGIIVGWKPDDEDILACDWKLLG